MCIKFTAMKRFIVIVFLLACVAAVTYASLRSIRQKAPVKSEKKEVKKHHQCSHTCMFS
jgi:hypothetical protein